MDIYIDPEMFKIYDKSNNQNRYITMKEIAYVACRITTSALRNGYSTHLISYNTFLTKGRADYKKFTHLSPTRHKLVQKQHKAYFGALIAAKEGRDHA